MNIIRSSLSVLAGLAVATLSATDQKNEYEQKAQDAYEHGDLDNSILNYRKALIVKPECAQLLLDYANILNVHNSPAVAFQIYGRILDMGIKNTSVLYNSAYTQKRLGNIDACIEVCKKIIQEHPHYTPAHFALATSYLTLGNFELGWPEYEWRWKQGNRKERIFKEPAWDGKSLKGKSIYIHAEQGLGDTFQFIRYAKIAKGMGAHVIAAVQKPLVPIISLCPYIDTTIELETTPEPFDCQAALMTLPGILKTAEKTIPCDIPYLYTKPALVTLVQEKLKTDKNFKIGICWQAGKNYSTNFVRLTMAHKSIPTPYLTPLATISGISWYSLQRTDDSSMNEQAPEGLNIIRLDSTADTLHGCFMDTAARMKNMDLIITVDTSIAHLAGGLGLPVWVLLPKPADWRWLLNRTDSPWYPTMHLFRQSELGQWSSVIDEVKEALIERIKQKKADLV